MAIVYNLATRTFDKAYLTNIRHVDKSDSFYNFRKRRACNSIEEAIAKDISGFVYWLENDNLYEAASTGSWDCRPVTAETQPVFIHGINWGNAYFVDRTAAALWVSTQGIYDYDIRYADVGDVYCVHYHY